MNDHQNGFRDSTAVQPAPACRRAQSQQHGWQRLFPLLLGIVLALAALPALVRAEAGQTAAAYPVLRPGQALVFPHDHGAHPQHRTEWWYITGWLSDEAGVERGFQLTFFRVRTLIGEDNPSQFAPRQLILAHAAIADPGLGRLLHAERSARAYPGLAAAAEGRTAVEVDGWFLRAEAPGEKADENPGENGHERTRYRSRIEAETFGYELDFLATRPPMLQGEAGFSQKAPARINASHYYSRPQLQVSGVLRLGEQQLRVSGRAWLDHEWSSEILPAEAEGWDWLGINLDDGGALMLFQMRGHAGTAIWAAGSLLDADGSQQAFAASEIHFTPRRHWQSPRTGARYPVEWEIALADGRRFAVRPLFDDQELDSRASTGAVYWEGAVRLDELRDDAAGRTARREAGRGYLEMTGYFNRLRM